jgi:hypothetical protein
VKKMMNFQGYSADKPSSRVLNPPGGRLNNIFGSSEETARQEASAPKPNARTSSNIFGAPDEPVRQEAPRQNARSESNIFSNQPEAPKRQTEPPNAQHGRKGYNTITGEAYDDRTTSVKVVEQTREESKPQQQSSMPAESAPEHVKASQDARNNLHTSSRVLKPPGGGGQTRLW